jgi:hypothetical protein
MCEEWKTINNYPNHSISNFGVIRNNETKRILKLSTSSGYLRIGLCKDGLQKHFSQHQLLGLHFIPNPENYKQIDHINGIRNDNRIENLRWGNQSQNQRNKKKRANCSSQYQGVSYFKRVNKWAAAISINKETKYLGYFATELEAFNVWKTYVIENGLQEFYSQVDFSLNQLIN